MASRGDAVVLGSEQLQVEIAEAELPGWFHIDRSQSSISIDSLSTERSCADGAQGFKQFSSADIAAQRNSLLPVVHGRVRNANPPLAVDYPTMCLSSEACVKGVV